MVQPATSSKLSTMRTVPDAMGSPIGRRRWLICALVFFATTINYMDRTVLGLLAPMLQTKIGWSEAQYGYIVTSFQIAYAAGLLVMGPLVDRLGSRLGYAIAIVIWSLSAMAHSLARTVTAFAVARFGLGFGEAGNFPSAIKTVAEWFPRKERALATGIFNSGTNIGATFAPLVVPWIALNFGWQYAFLLTGAFSAVWIVCWLTVYRKPQDDVRLSAAELDYIQSDPVESAAKIPWAGILRYRQAWSFVLGKFITDPVWWFFLFWLPKFLSSVHHVSLSGLALPLIVIYNSATIGSIFGGWLAAHFIKAGWTVNRARKTTMFIVAIAVVPVMVAAKFESLWASVVLISIAVAAHQGWSANLLTLPSDMFPKSAVASVVGMGTFAGSISGAMIASFAGLLLQKSGSYVPLFLFAGSAYLFALFVIHLLSPRLQPVTQA
jgi:MFS transporter, ACS family, aldohexuronate transporter